LGRRNLAALMHRRQEDCTSEGAKRFYVFFCGLGLEVQKKLLREAGVYIYPSLASPPPIRRPRSQQQPKGPPPVAAEIDALEEELGAILDAAEDEEEEESTPRWLIARAQQTGLRLVLPGAHKRGGSEHDWLACGTAASEAHFSPTSPANEDIEDERVKQAGQNFAVEVANYDLDAPEVDSSAIKRRRLSKKAAEE
ncbi:unnamed protein product, partial [Effrenium voratum]